MARCTVRFLPQDRRATVEEDTRLSEAAAIAGVSFHLPCGGRGTCGHCAVELRLPGEGEWRRGLLCQTLVDSDLEVRLQGEEALCVLTDSAAQDGPWDPAVRAVAVDVPPCPRGSGESDAERLSRAVEEGTGEKCGLELNAVRGLGPLLARTGGHVWAVVCMDSIIEVCAAEPEMYMAAFDLGTTTIAGYLIDVKGRRVVAAEGAPNPQARFGGDVISRIDHALNGDLAALRDCAVQAVDALLAALCARVGADPARVLAVSLAGNTCMHHLFLGISPDSLARAPYNPAIRAPLVLRAKDAGLHTHPAAGLMMLPVIGGFVGADTVACLVSGDWLRQERLTLLVDIGTNGELVLGDQNRRAACSTAAGPSLEGAKIACGMRGAEGAIDRVWLEAGRVRWHVIGDGPARGICGSGLIDLAAALLETGELAPSGALRGGEYRLGDTGVVLTQRDVRELQLAKAAIAAGIDLLAARLGVALDQIEAVEVAGAFGNAIRPASACRIGLLPTALEDRIVPVGNAAGDGARRALTDRSAWRAAETLALGTEFVELAAMPEFQDVFVDHLGFEDGGDA